MFRLLYLKVKRHPQLGDVELPIVEEKKSSNESKPYSTVIIGANGTGKSYILRTVAEIFRQFKNYRDTNEKDFVLPFDFHIRYQYSNNTYEIISRDMITFGRGNEKQKYLFFKNRSWSPISYENNDHFVKAEYFHVSYTELEYPDNLIVSSIMLNDRFTFTNSTPDDFYQYLGIRRTRGMTSTQTFSRKTIRYLFDAKRSETFIKDFTEMLDFMGFEKFFKVHYNTKYHPYFFSGALNLDTFHKFFKEWWNTNATKRKRTDRLWGSWYYEKLEKENPSRFGQVVEYLNDIVNNKKKIINKPRSKSKRFELDLFNYEFSSDEYNFVEDLVIKLDILNLDGIQIKKKENEFSIEQSSSGEYHLLISLLGLYSKIKKNSLILIDEPEISLHPNWQMRYINFLKNMFRLYPGCHFILSTHSHFLVSDLESDSSSILALTRDYNTNILTSELLEGKDTYFWSAEEILYSVFKVRTTRNFYLENDLRELLHLIAIKSNETEKMKNILIKIKAIRLGEGDPMNLIINKADEYLNK